VLSDALFLCTEKPLNAREASCLYFASDLLGVVASKSFIVAALLDSRELVNCASRSMKKVGSAQKPRIDGNTESTAANQRDNSNRPSRQSARRRLRQAGHKLHYFSVWANQYFDSQPASLCELLEEVKQSLMRWQQRQTQLKTPSHTAMIVEVPTKHNVQDKCTDFDELE
jgi:hypothetical protein